MRNLDFPKVWRDLTSILGQERVIHTLARKRTNEITSIDTDGIWVMTEKSSPKSELVPKWMFEAAVDYLIDKGSLSNPTLLNSLKVMRSSFVMAALSRLEYVTHKTNPMRIFLRG